MRQKVKYPLKFGTDGIRGKADEFPFTDDALIRLGWAIAQWIKKTCSSDVVKILLGTDTRGSCQRIKQSLIAGLMTRQIQLVDAGVIPTPAVYQLIQEQAF